MFAARASGSPRADHAQALREAGQYQVTMPSLIAMRNTSSVPYHATVAPSSAAPPFASVSAIDPIMSRSRSWPTDIKPGLVGAVDLAGDIGSSLLTGIGGQIGEKCDPHHRPHPRHGPYVGDAFLEIAHRRAGNAQFSLYPRVGFGRRHHHSVSSVETTYRLTIANRPAPCRGQRTIRRRSAHRRSARYPSWFGKC